MRALRSWRVLVLWALATTQGYGAQVLGVQVTREQARFLIGMHIVINAAPPKVFRALQDYDAMRRYNPDLRAVSVVPTAEPNRVRLFTTLHTCVLFFCKTMHQEEVMTAAASPHGGVLQADLIPTNGEFSGHGRWTVTPCRAAPSPACVDIQILLVPGFWVPPVIGPWLIRRKMTEEAQRSSRGLEEVASLY